MKELGIQPIAGLANRIRAIYSALAFAEDFSYEIIIYWNKNAGLNCSFSDLFLNSGNLKIVEGKSLITDGGKLNILSNKLNILIGPGYLRKYRRHIFFDEIYKLREKNYDFKQLSHHNSVFLQSCTDFYKKGYVVNGLEPTSSIKKKVTEIVATFTSNNVIGLHIRRTDNQSAIRNSPDILFHGKISDELKKNSNTKFFLATDSKKTETDFKSKYGDIIITNAKEFNRNTKQGIIDAFVDILCLSETKKIYGSYYSSFSEMAASLKKIKLIVLHK